MERGGHSGGRRFSFHARHAIAAATPRVVVAASIDGRGRGDPTACSGSDGTWMKPHGTDRDLAAAAK